MLDAGSAQSERLDVTLLARRRGRWRHARRIQTALDASAYSCTRGRMSLSHRLVLRHSHKGSRNWAGRLAVICGSTIAGAQATTRAYGEMRPSLWPCDRTLSSLVSARPHWHCSRLPAPYQLLWGKRLTLSAMVTFKAFRDRAAISPASFNSSIA